MKKALLTLGIAASVGGCAYARTTYAPDGRAAHSIECSGGMMSWSACYTKAGEICGPRGYDVLSQNSDQNAAFGGGGGIYSGSMNTTRVLLIACK